jgi:predicted secreted protein
MFFRRRWLGLSVALLAACQVSDDLRGPWADAAAATVASAPDRTAQQQDCTGDADHRERAASTNELDIGPTDAAAPICIQTGQILRIHLPASPATGYRWVLEREVGSMLRMESDPGVEPVTGGRIHTWGFRAEQPGRAVLRFAYQQPLGVESASARVVQFEITVR